MALSLVSALVMTAVNTPASANAPFANLRTPSSGALDKPAEDSNPKSGHDRTPSPAARAQGVLGPNMKADLDWNALRDSEVATWFGPDAPQVPNDVTQANMVLRKPSMAAENKSAALEAKEHPSATIDRSSSADTASSALTATATGAVRGGINPNAVGCSSPLSLDFEQFANADYTKLDPLGSINGFLFTSISPAIWRSMRYFNTNAYVAQATGGAWLDFNGLSGKISFAQGPVSSFSLLASLGATGTLRAYDAGGNLLATAGPSGSNIFTGTMKEFRIVASAPVIDHVIWTVASVNSAIIDMLCANGSYFGGLPLAQTYGTGLCVCDVPKQFWTDRPVNTATGALTEQFTDISLPGPGINFTMIRSYTSADPTTGPMGAGWTHGYNASLAFVGSDVIVRSEDGQQLYFTAPANGTMYQAPRGTTTTLSGSPGTGWTFTKRDQSTLWFDTGGRLIATKDRLGVGLDFTYSNGNLATATDAAGRVVTFTYTPEGRLAQVSLADGRKVQYGYTNGNLTSVTNMRGKTSTLAYDAGGRLASITDPNGHNLFETVYNSEGRVTQQTDPRGKVTTFAWNPTTQTATRTDPRGKTWTEVYVSNVLVSQTDPLGNTTKYWYDEKLNRTSVVDPKGKSTAFTYDAAGNVMTRTGPAPSSITESWTYTPFNAVETHTNGRGKTTTHEYFANQLPKKITDPLGRATSFTWTANGLPDTVTDPRGKVTDFGYDADGNRTSILSPEGNLTTFGFDGFGRMTSMAEPRGNAAGANPADYRTTYAYNPTDQVTTVTDPLGRTTTNTYDDAGNLDTVTNADNKVTDYDYNADNQVTKVTDPRGGEVTTSYDNSGNVASVTTPAGTTTFNYDDANRRTGEITPRGNAAGADPAPFTWTYGFDANGNQKTISNATAGTTTTAFDELNRPISVTDALGKVTNTVYDADSNVTSVADPLNRVTGFGYDDADQLTSMTDPLNKTTTYGYDDSGNRTSETSPLGNKRTWTYDGDGRLVGEVDPRGNAAGADPNQYKTVSTYDPAGHLLSVTDPEGHTTTYAYNRVGNLTSRTDANNHTTRYSYDVLDRLTSVTGPANTGTTGYTYDATGNLVTRTDGNNRTTSYGYDLAGRLTAKQSPVGVWNYHYDAAGNQTSVETPAGSATTSTGDGIISRTFDALDRLVGIDYSDSTPDVAYAYDALRMQSMTDGAGTQTYGYDASGQLTSVNRDSQAFTYTYDGDGRLSSRTLPGGRTITQSWDDDSRPASITTASTGSASYGYDAAGNRTSTALGNQVTEMRSYDRGGWVTKIEAKDANNNLIGNHIYTRDAVGNPTRIDRHYGAVTSTPELYTYDEADRVIKACYLSCLTREEYTYDPVGNRLTERRVGGLDAGLVTSTYNSKDQLTQTSRPGGGLGLQPPVVTNYTYDANGNQTGAGSTTYTYNLGNQLTRATVNIATTDYTYDGDGNRLTSTTSGATTNYTWDVNNPLPEMVRETSPAGTRDFLNGAGGEPLATVIPGSGLGRGLHYLHLDDIGSVRAVTDTVPATGATYTYEAFGAPRTSPTNQTISNPVTFAGEYQDPTTGLYNLRARDYDPTSGRFTALDPIAQDIHDPYIAAYVYANNQPTLLVDPSGLCAIYDAPCMAKEAMEKAKQLGQAGVNYVAGAGAGALDLLPIQPNTAYHAFMPNTMAYQGGHSFTAPTYREMYEQSLVSNGVADPNSSSYNLGYWLGLPSAGGITAVCVRTANRWATTTGGRLAANGGSKIPWTSWQNYPKVTQGGREYAQVGDRLYARHAVDRMQPSGLGAPAGAPGPGRSISPNYIEDVLTNSRGVPVKGPNGEPRLSFTSGTVQVITEDNIVITVITR